MVRVQYRPLFLAICMRKWPFLLVIEPKYEILKDILVINRVNYTLQKFLVGKIMFTKCFQTLPKSQANFIAKVFLLFLCLAFLAGCSALEPTPTPTPKVQTGETLTVTYQVSGVGKAFITYRNDKGEDIDVDSPKLPWVKTLNWTFKPGTFPFMNAFYKGGEGTGNLECTVTIDGFGSDTNEIPPDSNYGVTCGLNPLN